jgi:uncharacterized protein YbcI
MEGDPPAHLPRDSSDPVRGAGGELNSAVAQAVVRVYREHLGRGPTKAHAFYRDNVVVVILRDTLTRGERNLLANGHEDAVSAVRKQFQEVMEADLIAAIEQLTGRRVTARMRDTHVDEDMAMELFVLDRGIAGGALLDDLAARRFGRADES